MPDFELNRRFGIELEFDGGRITGETLSQLIRHVEPVLLSENKPLGPDNEDWVIKPDDTCGFEICSPTMPGAPGSMDIIAMVINLLNFDGLSEEWNTPITKRCSYHLHIEINDLSPIEIFRFLQTCYRIEKGIKELLPPSRRRSEYAKPLRNIFQEYPENISVLGVLVQDRNIAVNISNYLTRGTVEIRYAAGTTNSNKINFWILLWSCILERSLRNDPPEEDLTKLKDVLDWLRWTDDGSDSLLSTGRGFLLQRVETLRSRKRRQLTREMEDAEDAEVEVDEEE